MQKRILGRTGLEVSDISFGSSRLRTGSEDLVRHALDRGVEIIEAPGHDLAHFQGLAVGLALLVQWLDPEHRRTDQLVNDQRRHAVDRRLLQ